MSVFPSKVNYATGDILTATDMNEIGQAVNLLDGAQFAAGKNKIINGDFGINQRAFTSNTTDNTYNFDRWVQNNGGSSGTLTVTPQTFTPGAAPVAGYEGSTFVQCVTAAGAAVNTYAQYSQKIEDVRTFAGQTVTASFWAKATSGTPKVAVIVRQNFGSGGSPSSQVETLAGSPTISTSWTRYTVTFTVPSISGKTIGTAGDSNLQFLLWISAGSDFNARTGSIGLQNNTFQFWGVQVEAANTASNFQTATGTKGGELALCQRYYYRAVTPENAYGAFGTGIGRTSTTAYGLIPLPVPMRITPTSIEYSAVRADDGSGATGSASSITISTNFTSRNIGALDMTFASGITQYRPYVLEANNSTAAYVAFSAEL